MSDYIFMLESHLNPEQNQAVAEVQAAAVDAGVSLFLAGGALRDMLGGNQIRDLDFTVEGNALKVAKALAKRNGVRIVSMDELSRSAEVVFPSGVTAEIAMARQEVYRKPGGKPQVSPAFIQDDLRRRDFGVNAMALSLAQASKGLLLDPTNGQADLGRKEMRALAPLGFYNDPVRLLRLVRYRVRYGFTVDERTQSQFQNARENKAEQGIPARVRFDELSRTAGEPNPGEVIRALDEDGLLTLYSPALTGAKANLAGLAKFDKAAKLLQTAGIQAEHFGTFLFALTEKLSARDKAGLIKTVAMPKAAVDRWQKLDARARKLEKALKAPALRRPSQVYNLLRNANGEEMLFLLYRSAAKPVQDRLRTYLQKSIELAGEITDAEVAATGVEPGSPKFAKTKESMVAARIDGKTKKPEPPPVVIPPEPLMRRGPGRAPQQR